MALTDLKIEKAKAKAKPYKLYDSLGLFVLVKPNGSKLWRQKYQLDGKERTIAHGSYLVVRCETHVAFNSRSGLATSVFGASVSSGGQWKICSSM